jgi:hypothetical protein
MSWRASAMLAMRSLAAAETVVAAGTVVGEAGMDGQEMFACGAVARDYKRIVLQIENFKHCTYPTRVIPSASWPHRFNNA